MYKRTHHQAIAKILACFNADLLGHAQCYFAGGTAITLQLDEYRESRDIDFLCASPQGFRLLRDAINFNDLGHLVTQPINMVRELKRDRYGIRTAIEMDGSIVKVEFVSEGRIELQGEMHPQFGLPTLTPNDLFAEKLLATTDRGLDRFVKSRDVIDLAMMIQAWGDIPQVAWEKAYSAYGDDVIRGYDLACNALKDTTYFEGCLRFAEMDLALLTKIPDLLLSQPRYCPQSERGSGSNYTPLNGR